MRHAPLSYIALCVLVSGQFSDFNNGVGEFDDFLTFAPTSTPTVSPSASPTRAPSHPPTPKSENAKCNLDDCNDFSFGPQLRDTADDIILNRDMDHPQQKRNEEAFKEMQRGAAGQPTREADQVAPLPPPVDRAHTSRLSAAGSASHTLHNGRPPEPSPTPTMSPASRPGRPSSTRASTSRARRTRGRCARRTPSRPTSCRARSCAPRRK